MGFNVTVFILNASYKGVNMYFGLVCTYILLPSDKYRLVLMTLYLHIYGNSAGDPLPSSAVLLTLYPLTGLSEISHQQLINRQKNINLICHKKS